MRNIEQVDIQELVYLSFFRWLRGVDEQNEGKEEVIELRADLTETQLRDLHYYGQDLWLFKSREDGRDV